MSGYAAYAKTQNAVQTGRDVEYRLLGQVTASLIDADDGKVNHATMVEIVLWNREVWAAFRMDLSHPHNQFPEILKKGLIDLANWVERETSDILNGNSDLKTLIEVNKNIMDGLKPKDDNMDAA